MLSGNEGCKCDDVSSILASLEDRRCTTARGLPGVIVNPGSSDCVTYDYGSGACLRHDLLHNPACEENKQDIPPWCFQSWCYVDAKSCRTYSEDDIYKSDLFPVDIYYSYATCNSTENFWLEYAESLSVAGGVNITAAVPDLFYPLVNKQLPDGTLLWTTTEDKRYYFDDTIPYGGIYIDYVNSLVNISKGDIQSVAFTHTSRASLKRFSDSRYDAAVRDVENGLVDMAVGPFWITEERLKMTSFTVPLTYDKTVLVIPKPGTKTSLAYQTQKVLEPFTYGLWGVVLAVIVVASLLSVWFTDREMAAKKRYGLKLRQQGKPWKRRKLVYFRLMLDAILEKGMFFFSAGIEQDMGASLPHKVLMFGFGFFILIAVSAYVANLAAFLTQTGLEKGVGTMQQVVDRNIPICGHPALEEDIRSEWPKANLLFPSGGGPETSKYEAMFEAYARGDCKVLAFGREDTAMNINILKRMCELDLVYTDVLVRENPIAFPIRKELASEFNHWMQYADTSHTIQIESVRQEFIEKNDIQPQCEVELSKLSKEAQEADNDFARVSPGNMFFPIMLFVGCALIAAVLQLIHDNERKKGNTTTFGRKSTLDFYSIARRLTIQANNDAGGGGVNARRGHASDFSEANLPGGEFHENSAPQSHSSPRLGSTSRGSSADTDKADDDSGAAVEAKDNDISNRLKELVESGMIDEVLDCFDFLQAMKLKKDR